MKKEMSEAIPSKSVAAGSPEKQSKDIKTINDVCRTLDIGCIMRLVLMENEGIKIVEEIIKVVRKMKTSAFLEKRKIDFWGEFIKKNLIIPMSSQLVQ